MTENAYLVGLRLSGRKVVVIGGGTVAQRRLPLLLANGADVSRSIEEDTRDLLRSFADWIYRQLKEEYEYRMSDENVDESIRINEYEFDENGRIA